MADDSIHHLGRCCILDSGFCVLAGIILLAKYGVFASTVIKKRCYWPKHIKSDEIKAYFANKEIGTFNALPGTLDGVPFHLYCMKEEYYVMSLMSMYGTDVMTKKSLSKNLEGYPTRANSFIPFEQSDP